MVGMAWNQTTLPWGSRISGPFAYSFALPVGVTKMYPLPRFAPGVRMVTGGGPELEPALASMAMSAKSDSVKAPVTAVGFLLNVRFILFLSTLRRFASKQVVRFCISSWPRPISPQVYV